ncbi:hypothetical protein GUITHDRAFT_161601 [Guillardia theta CCMP2712]|uniref:Uncharacterized protein n=1 Tax=Guillardia theta (strain CCMP2712) TaxID=905079 RepID=L1JRI4_GUITC|nr:hypothetical protein GUITHDRAFT_161601 [Guillardia theta CCMP2712]EKX51067.1 hypothetical protein GUITHDRAFT_161601 [Guillardia theta CCMP2712]|eukprot:XP_005838047.1 hypothetical protein GUITHDRAFT_161601 [Guillardia theta CCMP2712]
MKMKESKSAMATMTMMMAVAMTSLFTRCSCFTSPGMRLFHHVGRSPAGRATCWRPSRSTFRSLEATRNSYVQDEDFPDVMDDVMTRIREREASSSASVSFKKDFRRVVENLRGKTRALVSNISLAKIVSDQINPERVSINLKFLTTSIESFVVFIKHSITIFLSTMLATFTTHYENARLLGKKAYDSLHERSNRWLSNFKGQNSTIAVMEPMTVDKKDPAQEMIELGFDFAKIVANRTYQASRSVATTVMEEGKSIVEQGRKIMPGILAVGAVAAAADLTDVALASAAGLMLTTAVADLAVADKKKKMEGTTKSNENKAPTVIKLSYDAEDQDDLRSLYTKIVNDYKQEFPLDLALAQIDSVKKIDSSRVQQLSKKFADENGRFTFTNFILAVKAYIA